MMMMMMAKPFQGIYRKSGSAARIKLLFEEVSNGTDVEKLLKDEDRVHDITGLFKKLLAQVCTIVVIIVVVTVVKESLLLIITIQSSDITINVHRLY